MLTLEEVTNAMPTHLRNNVTQGFVDILNNCVADPQLGENIRNSFINYTFILKEGRFKLEDYLNATAYVQFKLMGLTNNDAYAKTFPARYKSLVDRGAPQNEIAAYVSGYTKGKLVSMLMEKSLVPVWVANQDIYQEAINTQASIMRDTNASNKDRSFAADSVLRHLEQPKQAASISLDIGISEKSGLSTILGAIEDLAKQQQKAIASGASTPQEIAASTIIDVDAKEIA